MSYPEKRLIPVRRESALRAGMTIVLRSCLKCKVSSETKILLRSHDRCHCKVCGAVGRAWNTVGGCESSTRFGFRYCCAVREGRIFRLDTREKTKERTRELEKMR